MAGNFYDKFPDEVVEFDLDASDVLFNGDTISSAVVVPLTGGIAIAGTTLAGSIVSFRVSGGTAGSVANALAKITLASGQFRESLVKILIKRLPAQ